MLQLEPADKPVAPKKASGPKYASVFGQWLCDMARADERLVAITPACGAVTPVGAIFVGAIAGHLIEWYDYGVYAATTAYLTQAFFPGTLGTLGTLLGFAVSFALRPLGGFVWGPLGDRLGRDVHVVNDADAAGMAEDAHGAGRGVDGVVMLLTFGTGIGSAILVNGTLVPNTELGHLIVGKKEAEHQASSRVREEKGWSYEKWTEKVSEVLETYEALFWPNLFIAGGGISRKSDKWIPLLTNKTPVVPATLLNTAGIVGAAMSVSQGLKT